MSLKNAFLRLALPLGVITCLLVQACAMNALNGALFGPSIKTIHAELTKAVRNADLEPACGIIARIQSGCRDIPRGFDGTLRDSTGHETSFVMFSLPGDTLPTLHLVADWVLHRGDIADYRNPAMPSLSVGWRLDNANDIHPASE